MISTQVPQVPWQATTATRCRSSSRGRRGSCIVVGCGSFALRLHRCGMVAGSGLKQRCKRNHPKRMKALRMSATCSSYMHQDSCEIQTRPEIVNLPDKTLPHESALQRAEPLRMACPALWILDQVQNDDARPSLPTTLWIPASAGMTACCHPHLGFLSRQGRGGLWLFYLVFSPAMWILDQVQNDDASHRSSTLWIPAFAGMTELGCCHPLMSVADARPPSP